MGGGYDCIVAQTPEINKEKCKGPCKFYGCKYNDPIPCGGMDNLKQENTRTATESSGGDGKGNGNQEGDQKGDQKGDQEGDPEGDPERDQEGGERSDESTAHSEAHAESSVSDGSR